MVIDGVSGGISNSRYNAYIKVTAQLAECANGQDSEVLSELDLGCGDGMCMGYHRWREGDFGDDAIATPGRSR